MKSSLSLLTEKYPNSEILVFNQVKNLLLNNNYEDAFKVAEDSKTILLTF